MTEASDFMEQPRVPVDFYGETRWLHAHYEYAQGLFGSAMDEFPILVPDPKEGYIFTQTSDGKWFAHEGYTSKWNGS